MKLIPVVKVSRETIESILKSRVGLVQRQTWVKDGSGRKGHYRMQWVAPGEGKNASNYSKQFDLFGGGEEPPKAEAYKPKWPDKGEFVGNGLGDNGREYEGYRAKDGSTHFYDTENGREIGEDGEYLDKKKPTLNKNEAQKPSGSVFAKMSGLPDGSWYPTDADGKTIKDTPDGEMPKRFNSPEKAIEYGEKVIKKRAKGEKPNEPEKPAGGGKDFKAAQEWLFKNKYFGEDRISHSKIPGLLEKLDKGDSLSAETKKKLLELQANAMVNGQYSSDKDKADGRAMLEKVRRGEIDHPSLITAIGDALFVLGEYDKSSVGKESREGADIVASAIVKMNGGGATEKKPFEQMTFEARKKPGRPENVAETVRDTLMVSSGSSATYAGSTLYTDIEKFRYEAAKWAYENDKVGTGLEILDQYSRHKGIRKSILWSFRYGLAKAFGRG